MTMTCWRRHSRTCEMSAWIVTALSRNSPRPAPKLAYYDQVLAATGAVAISRIAKDYGMSARQLNALLAELGVQFKLSGQWLLYTKHAEQGYTKSETGTTDTGHVWMHTKWPRKAASSSTPYSSTSEVCCP